MNMRMKKRTDGRMLPPKHAPTASRKVDVHDNDVDMKMEERHSRVVAPW